MARYTTLIITICLCIPNIGLASSESMYMNGMKVWTIVGSIVGLIIGLAVASRFRNKG